MSPADAWDDADPTLCPECGKDSCEDHLPADESAAGPGPSADEARAADRERAIAREMLREDARREARRRLDAEERGPFIEPVGYRLRDWRQTPDTTISWRIAGWQPTESRVMFAAQRKAGKTTAVGSLVRSLVDGDPWLGEAIVTPITGTVAVLDLEMGANQLKHWYRDQGIVNDDRAIVYSLKGQAATLDLLDPACRARWAKLLVAENVRYLIVDNLRPILDALGLDESHDAGRWLVGFDALLREAGIPEACLVHHMGHGGERSRGDSRLRDWPDVEWRMMRQNGDDDASPRYIAAYGRDVDVPERQLTYNPATRRLTIAGGSRQQVRVQSALEAVVEVVGTAALSGRAIKDALAESAHARTTIEDALRIGVRTGRLDVSAGKHRARLYRVSQCPVVSQTLSGHSPPDRVSQCPDDCKESDTADTPPLPLDGNNQQTVGWGNRDTPRRRESAAHNTRSTRRRAAGEV